MLIHEAYLKLVDQEQASWKTKSHFFAVGAQAMRRILVDHARHRNRLKHGGDMARITLTDLNAKSLSSIATKTFSRWPKCWTGWKSWTLVKRRLLSCASSEGSPWMKWPRRSESPAERLPTNGG